MDGEKIVQAARNYVGVRFRHQGRSLHTGVDCLGLLVCVSRDLGLVWPKPLMPKLDERDYSHTPNEEYLRESMEMFLQPSDCERIMQGEVVLMRVDGRTQHVGVIGRHPQYETWTLIHAYAPARKVIEHQLDNHWRQAVVARYRLPDIRN